MAGRFVRASKYRHVFGRSTKKEQCYDNLRISNNAWDTNLVKVNPEYLSVNWQASGGGAFAVIPLSEKGKLPERLPLFRGHTAAVLDTDWSPFDDSFIASSSDDGKVFLWKVPENFNLHQKPEEITDVAPVAKLTGHSRKVGHVLFNPAAQNVLASSSGDYSIKLWDVESGAANLALKHGDIVQSLSWSADGSLLVTTCRDKKLRIWDARQQKPVVESPGHSGAKNSRVVWMGEHDRVATTGFSKMSDRQLGLWDIRAAREPIDGFQILDQISGVCMPFWDEGTQCLYLAGKGDGNIRYYEYAHDKFEYLSQYSSADPQRGMAFMPKRGVNTHENEVTRAFKTVNDAYIEPIPFIVPRRAEVFQEDVYPPTVGLKPAMHAADYFGGKEAILPPKISLASLHDGEAPEEVPAEQKHSEPLKAQSPPPEPAPMKQEAEPSTSTPISTTSREAAPAPASASGSMKDNQSSIAALATKFADKDEKDSSPGPSSPTSTSSFEEVPKPVERPFAASTTSSATKTPFQPPISNTPTARTGASDSPQPLSQQTTAATSSVPQTAQPQTSPHKRTTSSASGTAAETMHSRLADIKSLLESQNRTLAAQSEKLETLGREVEALKGAGAGNVAGGASAGGKLDDEERDEKVRRLEEELKSLRAA